LPADARQQGLAYFAELTQNFTPFFNDYDVWLTPTLPIETPILGYISHDTPFAQAMARNRQLLGYTVASNGIGAPAMSVPLFRSGETGLPIGSHFMAAPGQDRRLYELAFELEAAQPWAAQWPSLVADYR
jgi:amidase